jgi:hypothetical protein
MHLTEVPTDGVMFLGTGSIMKFCGGENAEAVDLVQPAIRASL